METEEMWIAMPRFGLQYEISNIGNLRSLDRTVDEIGLVYGVSKSTILRAANRKTWAHVE